MYIKSLCLRTVRVALGLCLFAFGIYLTIQGNIGVGPWDVFNLGLAGKLSMSFGNISVIISITVLIIDLCLKERIGIGTVLDAVMVGKMVVLYTYLELIPMCSRLWTGCICLVLGIIVICLAQVVYMSGGLGAGPRDMMLIGIGKRLHKLNIGTVSWIIYIVVLAIGWLLGGPVGVGTIISTFGTGIAMRYVFRIVQFEPRLVKHESLWDVVQRLRGKELVKEEPQ